MEDRTYRQRGMLHEMTVVPNHNNTGWVAFVGSSFGQGSANFTREEGEELARLLMAGPGDIEYECVEHKSIGLCLKCLM